MTAKIDANVRENAHCRGRADRRSAAPIALPDTASPVGRTRHDPSAAIAHGLEAAGIMPLGGDSINALAAVR
ncbi:MAG TPA: hypothetical protein VGK37_07815 [Casimicrobiaceae bacterium]